MEEIVEEFLKENEVNSGWQNLILQSDNLKQKLEKIIKELSVSY